MKKIIQIIDAKAIIPSGDYCYTPIQAPCDENNWVYKVKVCPFWEPHDKEKHGELPKEYCDPKKPIFDGAYCSYLKLGDWMENGTSLLWDQIKECGVNCRD
ncbi:hypothetical protein GW796_06385 [archaeon]|nr:hypothetical protein [archaeon]